VMARPEMEPVQREINLLRNGTSLDGFFHLLTFPEVDCATAASILLRTVIGPGRDIATLPRLGALSDEVRLFLEESPLSGHVSDRNLDVYLAASRLVPTEWLSTNADCRMVLRGTLPDVSGDKTIAPAFTEAWRGLWRLINLFQDLPGFHVEFEGLDTVEPPDVKKAGDATSDGAWREVLELVGEGFRSLVASLRAADAPAPNLVGSDLSANGEVVGMIELGWSEARLGICEQSFAVPGWQLIAFSPETAPSMTQIVTTVLRKLQEGGAA